MPPRARAVPDAVRDFIRRKDPHRVARYAAVRAAVVVPANFALGSQVIGNAQTATFAAFGSFALLLFANFPGSRAGRAGSYVVLAVVATVLITAATLLATPDWLAVVAMLAFGFAVQFSGVVSSTVNGGTSAAMLAFILAIMLPGVRGDLGYRLAGWGLACAVAIPVALFVWPPQDANLLRTRTAVLCRALATMLRLEPPAPGEPDRLVAMRQAARELRETFRASASRTSGVTTGARLLVRLVDELEWLATAVTNACADAPDGWPEPGRRLRAASSRVLATCADTLEHDGSGPALPTCSELDVCLAELADARKQVARSTLDALRASAGRSEHTVAGEFERPLYAAHELGYAVDLSARTVATIARADGRTWWARLLGRDVSLADFGIAVAAQRAAARHLDRHSVWLQSSVRAAVGLALAVLLARVSGNQNAFWIGLGALSVLRSNALNTGMTVLRAIAGTALGFAIGGLLIAAIGTQPGVLWPLLPIGVFVAAIAPALISFVAGQAAFTMFSIILFNLIAPAGWRVGVLRIEDVGLGCAASLVAGLLFWPRGAAAALGTALGEAYRTSARYLQDSVDSITGHRVSDPAARGSVATAAGVRLDDALRQYLAEQGSKHVPLESVATLANGATRLRLAGVAIDGLRTHAPDGAVVVADDDRLARPADALDQRAHHVTEWYGDLADRFTGARDATPMTPAAADGGGSFLELILPAVDRCGDPERAARAERLLWSGQYVGDVERVVPDLAGPVGEVLAAQAHPWWRR